MATLNKVMLMGRLTENPDKPRTLPGSGTRVIRFRFAVGRSRKNPQTGQWENDPNPLYIDCEAFTRPDQKRDLVNLIQQYAKKGTPLYVEGRLVYETWDDKNGGGKRSKHKVVVDNIEFLGNNRGDGDSDELQPTGGDERPTRTPPPQPDDDYGSSGNSSSDGDDSIPF